MAEGKEEDGAVFEHWAQESGDAEDSRPNRAWPPLPTGFKLPDDPSDLKCGNYFELWGQCAAPSWWLRNYYRDGSVGFNCTERWENLRTCVILKFRRYDLAKRELRDINQMRELQKGPHLWEFRTSPPAYFKKFDYPPPEQKEPAQ